MAIPQQGRAPQARPSLLPQDIADTIANLFGGGDQQGGAQIPGGILPPGLDRIIQMIAQNFQGVGDEPQQVPMGAGGPVSDEELAQMLNGGIPTDQAYPEPQPVDPSEQVDPEQVDPGYTDQETSPEDVFTTDPADDAQQVADELTGDTEEEVGQADENVGPQVPVSEESSDEPADASAGFAAVELGSSKNKNEANQRGVLEMILPNAPEAVDAIMKVRPDDRQAAVASYLRTHPRKKEVRYTSEVKEQLKANYPEWAGDIDVATDATMPGIIQQAAAQKHAVDKTKQKVDLNKFSPELRPYLEQMSPGDVSKFVAKHLAADQGGGGGGGEEYWPRLKGKGIKIVNDDNFKRLGLKSGQKVCITIP